MWIQCIGGGHCVYVSAGALEIQKKELENKFYLSFLLVCMHMCDCACQRLMLNVYFNHFPHSHLSSPIFKKMKEVWSYFSFQCLYNKDSSFHKLILTISMATIEGMGFLRVLPSIPPACLSLQKAEILEIPHRLLHKAQHRSIAVKITAQPSCQPQDMDWLLYRRYGCGCLGCWTSVLCPSPVLEGVAIKGQFSTRIIKGLPRSEKQNSFRCRLGPD